MSYIKTTKDGKRIVLNPSNDQTLWGTPRHNGQGNNWNGTDLMLHITTGGLKVFYLYHWTCWQGQRDLCDVTNESGVKEFILEQSSNGAVSKDEFAKLSELGFDFSENV